MKQKKHENNSTVYRMVQFTILPSNPVVSLALHLTGVLRVAERTQTQ